MTIRPGATTAAVRLICPLPCRSPPPAATSTSKNVPSSSENSRRYSSRGFVELFPRAELEHQQSLRAGQVVQRHLGCLCSVTVIRADHPRQHRQRSSPQKDDSAPTRSRVSAQACGAGDRRGAVHHVEPGVHVLEVLANRALL